MTHLVLIVRNSYEGVHSGQIAFGGKQKMQIILWDSLRETWRRGGNTPNQMEIKNADPYTTK
jgi:hypothetical protein